LQKRRELALTLALADGGLPWLEGRWRTVRTPTAFCPFWKHPTDVKPLEILLVVHGLDLDGKVVLSAISLFRR
jgi:hypothetical protein